MSHFLPAFPVTKKYAGVAMGSARRKGPKCQIAFVRIIQADLSADPAAHSQRHSISRGSSYPRNGRPLGGEEDVPGAVQPLLDVLCSSPCVFRMFGNYEM